MLDIYDDVSSTIINKNQLAVHLLEKYHIIKKEFPKTIQGIQEGGIDWCEYLHVNKRRIMNRFFPRKTKNIAYLITLTSHPKTSVDDYKNAFNRIKKYKKFNIIKIHGVIEYTINKRPHAHIYIESTDYIRLERLKRIWKVSNIDLKRAFNEDGLKEYFTKDPNHITLL